MENFIISANLKEDIIKVIQEGTFASLPAKYVVSILSQLSQLEVVGDKKKIQPKPNKNG
jgi:hypothetical protein